MIKILLLLLLSVTCFHSFGQQHLLLQQFKYRIDRYRAISLNMNSGSNLQRFEPKLYPYKIRSSSSAAGFDISLSTIKSTDKILRTTTGSISTGYGFNKSENNADYSKARSYSGTVHYYILNKWFSDRQFIELGGELSGNKYNSSEIQKNPSNTRKGNDHHYLVTLFTGFGWGRRENITDMQNALWLNKDLEAVSRLTRKLSNDELIELGHAITKGNNTRVLDNRRRTLFILATVDEYLQKKELISKTDIKYFSSLNDVLFFAFNNNRLSGMEKFIRFVPSINGYCNKVQNSLSDTKHEYTPYYKSAFLSAGFSKHKPVSLTHQNNYSASLRLNYISYNATDKYFNAGVLTSKTELKSDIKQAGVNLFYEHAFYPNTRTNISIGLQTESGYQDGKDGSEFYGTATLTGLLSYFISYKTRLTGSIGTVYNKNMFFATSQGLQKTPKEIGFFANAGIAINL